MEDRKKWTELVNQTQQVNAKSKETKAWYALRTVTEQCDPFNDVMCETAQNKIDDAFDAAIEGIDCNPITAQSLKYICATFDQSVAIARKVLIKDLKPSQDYSGQQVSQGFDAAVFVSRYELQAELTTKVSASFDTDNATLSALSADSPIADLTAQVPMAVDLKTRAAGLSEFLEPRLLEEINRITDAHFARTLTAAEAIANASLAAAQTTAMIGTQPTTETAAELTARMNEFDRAAQAALTAFDTAVFGIPDDQAGDARLGLTLGITTTKSKTKAALQAAVSAPLQEIETAIAQLTDQAQADTVTQLKDRLAELGQAGNNWLTDGLAEKIDRTVAAYEEKVHQLKHSEKSAITIQRVVRGRGGRVVADALKTRAGQIRALTSALAGLTFTPPAQMPTFEAKWRDIQSQTTQHARLLENQNYTAILAEPRDRAIATALTQLEARKAAAIANHAPERQALIAGLAGQLGTLTTAGFAWAATLTTAATTARNALPEGLRDNVEMQLALTAAKDNLPIGLQNAVSTRVTAREALATATTSLRGWPAPGLSLDTIRRDFETARTTFELKTAADEFEGWDTDTKDAFIPLQQEFNAAVQQRDALIASFQSITTMAVPIDSLANRWTAIAAQETTLTTLRAPESAHAAMLADPQVTAKIAEVQTALALHNAPTDLGLERAAFRVGMNMALTDPALTTAAAVLDSAAASVTVAGLAVPALDKFDAAVNTVNADMRQEHGAAITARITYRSNIVTAQGVLAQVQDRTATGDQLQTAIGTIGAAPEIVNPGDGTNIFATADAAMATQRQNIVDGLATHTALVTAFTDAITTATEQLPDMTATPLIMALAKWTALNLANTTYDNAVGAGNYLFFGGMVHPDIDVNNTKFNTERDACMNNVVPETTEIRNAAAESLAAFVAVGSTTSEPVFDMLRDAVLNDAGVPAGSKAAVNAALAAAQTAITAEIQSRLDVHARLQALEADASAPIAKKAAIDAAKVLFQKLLLNHAYAACDKILADRLQALQLKVYGAVAEEAAQAQLLTKISHVAEATKMGTTSSLINMGKLWQNLESKFRDSEKGAGWKYKASLDDAFTDILDPSTPPKDTTEYVSFLRTAIERLNSQSGTSGLPAPYKDIAETALGRLEHRNDGPPQLCAWAMSANLRLVMSVIETFGDTRAARVSDMMGNNDIALHKGITLRQEDAGSITGYSREPGALWSQLHQRPIDFLPIETVTADNIPGSRLSADDIAALIEKMGTGDRVSIVGYVPAAGGQEATLTQEGWKSFCVALGVDAAISAFLEAKWPVSDEPILLSELHRRLEELLNNEAAYKYLRYLFGRKLERAYQELVL